MLKSFFEESMIKRAIEKGVVTINVINIRDFAIDKHKTVDDRPYGGGAGMVLKVDVLHKALMSLKTQHSKTISMSPQGGVFNQAKAQELSKLPELILLCGHYEGLDDRIMEHIDEEISIGDFILTGGELAAATITDSIVRLLPGVLKKEDASVIESFWQVDINVLINAVGESDMLARIKEHNIKKVTLLEFPHYTRPQEFMGKSVPSILLSGNTKDIERWKLQQAFNITLEKRPDLLKI